MTPYDVMMLSDIMTCSRSTCFRYEAVEFVSREWNYITFKYIMYKTISVAFKKWSQVSIAQEITQENKRTNCLVLYACMPITGDYHMTCGQQYRAELQQEAYEIGDKSCNWLRGKSLDSTECNRSTFCHMSSHWRVVLFLVVCYQLQHKVVWYLLKRDI